MIFKSTLVYFGFVLFTNGCWAKHKIASRTSSPGVRNSNLGVYHGVPTTIEKTPYMVSILVENKPFCSGTIVSLSWIVTSGDCVAKWTPDQITIVAGSDDGISGKNFTVNQIVIHPQYGITYLDYNFACLGIQGQFQWSDQVQPATLPWREPIAVSNMSVAGWGDTSSFEMKESNSVLNEGWMYWIALGNCENYYAGFELTWTNRMGCAYNRGSTTLCRGDFGVPCVQGNVFYGIFIAIANKGICSYMASPSIFASTFPESSWMSAVTGAQLDLQ